MSILFRVYMVKVLWTIRDVNIDHAGAVLEAHDPQAAGLGQRRRRVDVEHHRIRLWKAS